VDIALDTSSSTINLPNLTIDALGLTGSNLASPDQAAATQALLDEAQGLTSQSQAQFGAQQNGLTAAADTIANQNLNAMASRSQISDADMARVYTEQNRQQVLTDAGAAMQAQSNQNYSNVLTLLG
jgi:flagellin